eukprot:scaffold37257_cov54-Attheya_sp.AAC.3
MMQYNNREAICAIIIGCCLAGIHPRIDRGASFVAGAITQASNTTQCSKIRKNTVFCIGIMDKDNEER